eukprot:7056696-Prymnesium_polylepis.1
MAHAFAYPCGDSCVQRASRCPLGVAVALVHWRVHPSARLRRMVRHAVGQDLPKLLAHSDTAGAGMRLLRVLVQCKMPVVHVRGARLHNREPGE